MLGTVILIALLILLIGAIPTWPYSRSWGYYPSGLITILLVIAFIVFLVPRI